MVIATVFRVCSNNEESSGIYETVTVDTTTASETAVADLPSKANIEIDLENRVAESNATNSSQIVDEESLEKQALIEEFFTLPTESDATQIVAEDIVEEQQPTKELTETVDTTNASEAAVADLPSTVDIEIDLANRVAESKTSEDFDGEVFGEQEKANCLFTEPPESDSTQTVGGVNGNLEKQQLSHHQSISDHPASEFKSDVDTAVEIQQQSIPSNTTSPEQVITSSVLDTQIKIHVTVSLDDRVEISDTGD